ncbi:hypothetical protein NL676_027417 [Syzygium grande]|nr:hypothetical protein NL676_027417 [Syzygium grande]
MSVLSGGAPPGDTGNARMCGHAPLRRGRTATHAQGFSNALHALGFLRAGLIRMTRPGGLFDVSVRSRASLNLHNKDPVIGLSPSLQKSWLDGQAADAAVVKIKIAVVFMIQCGFVGTGTTTKVRLFSLGGITD